MFLDIAPPEGCEGRYAAPGGSVSRTGRQYLAADLAGHRWTFSETLADVDPASWGGELRTSVQP
jgi:hypothetical protein